MIPILTMLSLARFSPARGKKELNLAKSSSYNGVEHNHHLRSIQPSDLRGSSWLVFPMSSPKETLYYQQGNRISLDVFSQIDPPGIQQNTFIGLDYLETDRLFLGKKPGQARENHLSKLPLIMT